MFCSVWRTELSSLMHQEQKLLKEEKQLKAECVSIREFKGSSQKFQATLSDHSKGGFWFSSVIILLKAPLK